jgi:hypothetical protein
MRNPAISDFIQVYPMYRILDDIYIQSQIILCEGNESALLRHDFNSFISERETVSEDGAKISEWKINVSDLEIYWNKKYGF